MQRFLLLVSSTLVFGLFLLGCGAPRETVTVVNEVETIESTEDQGGLPEPEVAQVAMPLDTVEWRRFDRGKMWTFDNPPVEYFRKAYGFSPTDAWFSRARLGALRFGGGCSASFVSPNGLVMTNHHCGRDYISDVSRSGEDLLDNGFYARSTGEERKAKELYVDQLIKIEDVTGRVYNQLPEGGAATSEARDQRVDEVETAMNEKLKRGGNANLRVEVVPLYSGARYSAYTYRRYEDVRLVMAPELSMGFFGGAPDNFTYPRYVLDLAFFRVYDNDGKPLQTTNYFKWDVDGAEEGDAVFVVGNPGSTSRLNTIAQLKYKRDFDLPQQLDMLRTRASILEPYVEANPDSAEAYDLRNTYFSIENSIKNLDGQLRGLRDPYLMARRAKAQKALRDSIQAVDSLQSRYGNVFQEIEQNTQSRRIVADDNAAFVAFSSQRLGSRILSRAVYGYFYDFLRTRGASADRIENIRSDAMKIEDWPRAVEKEFIIARLNEFRDAFGPQHPAVREVLKNQSPEAIAENLVQNSALMDSTGFVKLLDDGYLSSKDASVSIIKSMAPQYLNTSRQTQDYQSAEENLSAKLSRALFAVYGESIPPDASFTLRLADGRVQSYQYNGTRAPAFTNFHGLYDHYYSYNASAWRLPQLWLEPPAAFDPETPFNLVSTNDISGGNSGSPLLNRDLEVVGLIFDSNIEALPNEYLYTDQTARAISVDARAILEALDDVYEADRIAQELTTGDLISTEEEADAASASR